ncbi:MAG: hypothetical protein DBY37_13940 [Desulfovibrionaceae bacterium]|nr:MAG: hypothetical protein DBY37_13940 [Desulfovibrionaceae bacterium]
MQREWRGACASAGRDYACFHIVAERKCFCACSDLLHIGIARGMKVFFCDECARCRTVTEIRFFIRFV